jgi:hypothetical protein
MPNAKCTMPFYKKEHQVTDDNQHIMVFFLNFRSLNLFSCDILTFFLIFRFFYFLQFLFLSLFFLLVFATESDEKLEGTDIKSLSRMWRV